MLSEIEHQMETLCQGDDLRVFREADLQARFGSQLKPVPYGKADANSGLQLQPAVSLNVTIFGARVFEEHDHAVADTEQRIASQTFVGSECVVADKRDAILEKCKSGHAFDRDTERAEGVSEAQLEGEVKFGPAECA